MSRVIDALKAYHNYCGEMPVGGRLVEAVPAGLAACLGAYAIFGGPAVEPKIPADAKQVAIAQPPGKYVGKIRAFTVSLEQYEAGVDCGGMDPWIGGPNIEEAKVVEKDAEQVVFSCKDSARLQEEFGEKPTVGTKPLYD